MARIAALLPERADRDSLARSTTPDDVVWADSWRDLYRLVRREPIGVAVADLHAESRKDGVLRVFRFAQRFPHTPIVVWGDLDGREMFRLGKAGAADLLPAQLADDPVLVAEILEEAGRRGLTPLIHAALADRLLPAALAVVEHASDHIPDQIQVPTLAARFGLSVSTLERRCERWGLPTPGRLLLWLRVLYGLRWLLEPGRSVESVADQLGYSSGAAFRRAIKATIGGRPTPLRNAEGFDRGFEMFLTECPGVPDERDPASDAG